MSICYVCGHAVSDNIAKTHKELKDQQTRSLVDAHSKIEQLRADNARLRKLLEDALPHLKDACADAPIRRKYNDLCDIIDRIAREVRK